MARKEFGKVVEIDMDLLQPNPLQPRGSIPTESLMELADSIRTHGLLEPIIVGKTPAGYQIIAGERRWRASKIVGMEKIPAVIKDVDPEEMLVLAIVENLQREDLNIFEKAAGYKKLNDEFGFTHDEIARQVGVSRPAISNSIRLLNIPDMIKDAVMTGTIPSSMAEALLHLRTPEMMIQVFTTKVLRENYSVRQVEELARRFAEEGKIIPGVSRPAIWKRDKKTQEIEKEIMEKFEKSKADISRSVRQIKVVLKFKDEATFKEFYEKIII